MNPPPLPSHLFFIPYRYGALIGIACLFARSQELQNGDHRRLIDVMRERIPIWMQVSYNEAAADSALLTLEMRLR